MKCLKCGAELQEMDLFCPRCGEKVVRINPNEGISNGEQQPKKKSSTVLIVIIVVLVIALLIGGIVFFIHKVNKLFSKEFILGSILEGTLGNDINDELSEELLEGIFTEGMNSISNGTVLDITSGNNDTAKFDKNNAEQVDYNGFRFYLPNTLEKSVEDKGIAIRDVDNQWFAMLIINEGNLIDNIQDSLIRDIVIKGLNETQQDIKITSSSTVTINGVDYVLFEGEQGGETLVLAFAKINSEYMLTTCLTATDGNIALSTISEIIKNIEPIEN